MSPTPTDPPGAPQSLAPSAFSPQDAMEFIQRMWNPFGVPIPGFAIPGTSSAAPGAAGAAVGGIPGALPFPSPATMFAALDPAEVERKISELKIVESWLTMSLNMMQMSIKTMELQKASLEAMRGSQASSGKAKEAPRK